MKKRYLIGDRIAEIVLELGITYREFAASIKMQPYDVSRVTTEKVPQDSPIIAEAIQNIFIRYPDISQLWLLNGVGPMIASNSSVKKLVAAKNTSLDKVDIEDTGVAERLRGLREGAGYTMKEMAIMLGATSHSAWDAIEHGFTAVTVPKLIILAKVFGKSYSWIIHGKDDDQAAEERIKTLGRVVDELKIRNESLEFDNKELKIGVDALTEQNKLLREKVKSLRG